MSQLKQLGSKMERIPPSSAFCLFRALNGLDDVHSHGGGQFILLSPLIQMLISSRDTLTDTPRNNV